MKKEFSRYIIPNLRQARKRLTKETKTVYFDLKDELIGIGAGKYYHIKTYGCQGNLADSEKLSGILEKMGFTCVNEDDKADIIIFNTCAIRENAENRVFGELGRIKNLKKKNPNMLMILCGCMSHEENVVEAIASKYPQVDIVFGTHNIHKIGEFIYEPYIILTHAFLLCSLLTGTFSTMSPSSDGTSITREFLLYAS